MDKVEGLLSIFCRQAERLCLSLTFRQVPQIHWRQRELRGRIDHLDRLPIDERIARTPCFVTPENLVKTLLEGSNIEGGQACEQ